MIKKAKRSSEAAASGPVIKKQKKEKSSAAVKLAKPEKTKETESKTKKVTFQKTSKKESKTFKSNYKGKKPRKEVEKESKPTDWVEFKKKKKEENIKRKKSKGSYDIILKAKKIGEDLRRKTLKGGIAERTKLVNELHDELKGQGNYAKFVLTHDIGRIVQYLLKYSTQMVREEITKELIPVTVQMLESKYGKFCVKRMLKYGSAHSKSSIIKAMYGHAVKLASHAICSSVFEYAYTTWASPLEKQHLMQEFFGDMYKQSKDEGVKHLRDVYEKCPDMKNAALGATKANLTRVLNKDLYDSALVQSVLHQFLSECSNADRSEIITEISPHVVVLSNSKDGARAVMSCLWHGSNKERKVIIKSLKEHIIELCKHEHGHCSIIALLDCVDDTVLLQKSLLNEILNHTKDLAENEWGRKVLLWLVAPAESTHFHPQFIKELEAGRAASTCKKSPEIRRKEILAHSIDKLLSAISTEPSVFLTSASIAVVTLAVLKTGAGDALSECLQSVCTIIVDPEWKITENETSLTGIEHPGLHMILKKLAQHDKSAESTFGEALMGHITEDVIKAWIKLNRGCFLLVAIYENGTESTQSSIKDKLIMHHKALKKQTTSGAAILLKKCNK